MNLALLSVIISFLSLDTTIAFQMLISSPLIACPLLGWLLGDVGLGFELGFLFQLLWLGRIPAGASIIPEGNLASMIATALVLLNKNAGYPNAALTIVFVEGILFSYAGATLTVYYRKLNSKILDLALKQVESAHFKIILLLEATSMGLYLLIMFGLTFLAIKASMLFLPDLIVLVGTLFEKQLIIIKPAILGLGLAFVYPLLKETLRKSSRQQNVGNEDTEE